LIAIDAAIGRDKVSRTKRLILAMKRRDLEYMMTDEIDLLSVTNPLTADEGYDNKRWTIRLRNCVLNVRKKGDDKKIRI
jgi:hypothetical protein